MSRLKMCDGIVQMRAAESMLDPMAQLMGDRIKARGYCFDLVGFGGHAEVARPQLVASALLGP